MVVVVVVVVVVGAVLCWCWQWLVMVVLTSFYMWTNPQTPAEKAKKEKTPC
jgi:hypothetical protein